MITIPNRVFYLYYYFIKKKCHTYDEQNQISIDLTLQFSFGSNFLGCRPYSKVTIDPSS